jgi:hypothetical protein
LGQVSIVSHSYQTYFDFPGSDLNLDCGLRDHVITRFTSLILLIRESIFVGWESPFPIVLVPRYKLFLCHSYQT